MKTLKVTHAFRYVEVNVLVTRAPSCTCDPCWSGLGECENREKVGPWERKALKPETARDETDKAASPDGLAVPPDPPALYDELATAIASPAQEEELATTANSVPTHEVGPSDESQLNKLSFQVNSVTYSAMEK